MRWQDRATCRDGADPDLFAPPKIHERRGEKLDRLDYAKIRYCNGCPVRGECLAFAKDHGYGGIWGGLMLEHGTPTNVPPRGRKPSPCGTESAWRRHRRKGEPIDAACQHAHDLNVEERTFQPCGTTAAYRRHARRGEQPCEQCKAAHLEWRQRHEIDTGRRTKRRQQAREARERARVQEAQLLLPIPNTAA